MINQKNGPIIAENVVRLSDVFFKMAIAIARQEMGDRLPDLKPKTIEALSQYRKDYRSFTAKDRSYNSRKASVGGWHHKTTKTTPQGKQPIAPECPSDVQDVLNAMVLNDMPMERHEAALSFLFTKGSIPAYVVKNNSVVEKILPNKVATMGYPIAPQFCYREAGGTRSFGPVVVTKADVDHVLTPPPKPEPTPKAAPSTQEQSAPKNKGGAPRKIDWDAFYLEVIRIANTPDGLPDTQAGLERQMADWFSINDMKEPGETSLKVKVREIYQHIKREGQ